MSSIHRSGPFDTDDESSRWHSFHQSFTSWIKPPSFATGVLMFWILVFAISMFWHRAGNPRDGSLRSAADQYTYGVDPYPTSLPIYGYPAEFNSAAMYKYFYNLYMKRLTAASTGDVPTPRPSVASPEVPKQATQKIEQQKTLVKEPVSNSEPIETAEPEKNAISLPVLASPTEPVERADVSSYRFVPSQGAPVDVSRKTVRLPERVLPQQALPDPSRFNSKARMNLRVAPVGLPGYEREPVAMPKSAVKSVYPQVDVVALPSVQSEDAPK